MFLPGKYDTHNNNHKRFTAGKNTDATELKNINTMYTYAPCMRNGV